MREPFGNQVAVLGKGGTLLQSVPITEALLPPRLAGLVRKHPLREPLASYETFAVGHDRVAISLPESALLMIGHNAYRQNHVCIEATHHMDPSHFKALVESVRRRVLTFVRELGATDEAISRP